MLIDLTEIILDRIKTGIMYDQPFYCYLSHDCSDRDVQVFRRFSLPSLAYMCTKVA